MRSTRFVLGLAALALLALTAADSGRAQSQSRGPEVTEEFHQTYPLSPTGRVSLSNINGNVRIAAWDRNEVKVDAVKRAYTQQRLTEARIKVDAGANSVSIETEYPDYHWTSRDLERQENPANVEYTLTVPRTARVEEVNLINGALDLEGLGGPVHASSINGKLTARGLTGASNLSVINGRLEATLDRLSESGAVSLNAVNGPLVVTLPSDANATLHANTVHGGISNDFGLPVRVGEYVGRDLEGRLGSGSARVRLSNVNGPIQIKRAADGRTQSAVTNLLSEARGREDFDDDAEDAAREALDAQKEALDAQKEAARAVRDSQREIERANRDAQREAERAIREAEKATREVERSLSNIEVNVNDDSRRQSARESNSFQVSASPRVKIETFDGPVTVHAWDKNEVSYTAVKRAHDEREMKGIRVLAQGSGSEVSLSAQFDKTAAHVYRERGGNVTYSSNASTEFDVYVPRNATLYVSSGDGRLRVDGVSGELELSTGDGSIDVTGARGRLRARTGDGRIRVADFDGDAEATTGDGRITLDGSFRTLAARTGDGGISLSVPEGANATIETSAESVFNDGVAVAETPETEKRVRRWRLGGGGQLYTLRAGDGQIVIRRR
jgi:DUF4097 and DUF4098 domain-containing protein YvlB